MIRVGTAMIDILIDNLLPLLCRGREAKSDFGAEHRNRILLIPKLRDRLVPSEAIPTK